MSRHTSTGSRTAALALAALTGLTGLVATGTLAATAGQADAAASAYKPYGSTSAGDQRMRNGCHNYRYHYRLTPPTDQWTAELFLVNPNHHTVANAGIDAAVDRLEGDRSWYLCRNSTVSGRYTIKMKVTYSETPGGDAQGGFVRPSHFRLSSKHGR